ncbi:NAD-dependent protein deacetylase sirtuin-2 isoform X1 [Anthonomus grandis grandis]|uniref:NAD-dependent protein deacetylase sirtuin-2 isoform X1 n=1 Tax=Anthonomus grandis grandis TaxID=2921223 RepID=UPI00216685A5|nr:NAD-dependent protein deacetylase sirtuin-2 isoform X1 [Anthonomus grandis grandis]
MSINEPKDGKVDVGLKSSTQKSSSDKAIDKENGRSESTEISQSSDRRSSEDSGSGLNFSGLQRYLTEKLGFLGLDDDEAESSSHKVLNDVSLDGIVDYIQKNGCKNIITMAGAGISTSAGIPDFRSVGTGLYHNLQKYNLPHPQAIFELDFFNENPKPFFVLAKELYPGTFKPTLCHYFIKLLNDKGMLLRHYTQNIDTLERVAGIPEEKLVEAHGTFYTGHCLACREKYTLEWMKERIFKDEIPICEKCPGVVKPDIVFFGENLPEKFHHSIDADFHKCDLLIILGSSLVVHPFAGLVDMPPSRTPRLLINREKAGHRTGIMAMMGISGGLEFDKKGNSRDVAWLGDCDDGCQLLADKLGWGDELKELLKQEHEKIDKANEAKNIEVPEQPKI